MANETVFLSLGANQGDRLGSLREAFRRLADVLDLAHISSVYETEPMYLLDQPRFLNAVVSGTFDRGPRELLRETQLIEQALGRVRDRPNGPRTMDIDILLFGDHIVRAPDLEVPHPAIAERAFVLVPLLELAPETRDPLTGTRYRDYLDTLGEGGVSFSQTLGTAL